MKWLTESNWAEVCGKSQRGGFVNGTEHIRMFSGKFYKDVSLDLRVNYYEVMLMPKIV